MLNRALFPRLTQLAVAMLLPAQFFLMGINQCNPNDADGDDWTVDEGDCDDTNPNVNPDATEVCNGIDDNCDSVIDEGVMRTFYADNDGDGFGDATSTTEACTPPNGYVDNPGDCDDTKATTNPNAVEICDDVDNDCDNVPDDGLATSTYYRDMDKDGFGNAYNSVDDCAQPDGYVTNSGDCNDNNASINPTATETCDQADNNCNGTVDEGVTATYYQDADGDGYGNSTTTIQACTQPTGYSTVNTDCNDTNKNIYPGANEICDNKDQDCDGSVDEGLPTNTYYQDSDNDGYGRATSTVTACARPAGYAAVSGDCNDNNAAVNPGATEVCNSIDDDCDLSIDEGLRITYYQDSDADTYGNSSVSVSA
jgi:hypothetical protein